MVLLLALCVIVPIVELAVFVQVAQWIGLGEAILALLAISLLGLWLVKAQGVAVYRAGRAELAGGRVPGRPLVDGLLILAAGVLLLVPGFVTAAIGLILLVPLTRVPVRDALIRRWTRRLRVRPGPGRARVRVESVVVTDRSSRSGWSGAQELGRQRAIEPGGEPLG